MEMRPSAFNVALVGRVCDCGRWFHRRDGRMSTGLMVHRAQTSEYLTMWINMVKGSTRRERNIAPNMYSAK